MSKAAELASLASASETALSNRNIVINGDYTIAQRGTSFTQADTYSLDRWRLNQSGETMSVSQQNFTAGQTDVPRAKHYLRVIITTTGNNAGITQRVEGVNNLSGQSVTLSFYARGGQGGQAVPTTFRTYLNQNFGSGGSTAVNVQGSTNHGLTSSWQLFTTTVTLGSVSGKTVGTSPYTELFFQQTTAEACDFDIALVQLEVGPVATPFEHRSYGQELALCQRYYETGVADFRSGSSGAEYFVSSTKFIREMRAIPTTAYTAAASATSNVSGTPSLVALSTNTLRLTVASAAGGDVYYVRNFSLSAEL